ncbi:MAG: serine protease [Oscillatoria sp. PMC 1051.18]|nr:serine protease [Oscillatoria sp. PMC 1051.18]
MKFNNELPAILAGTAIYSALVMALPQPAIALTGQQVNNIAREITVLIARSDGGQGSGVIISKNGKTYYVLTAHHVVKNRENRDGEIKYQIVTHDQNKYQLNYNTVKQLPNGVDLAVIEFTSDKNYPVATLANTDSLTEGTPVFISGWPKQGAVSNVTDGQLIRQFVDGRVSTILARSYRGYQMGYTNNTIAGMSGGPVLDAGGRLVAIHGLADRADANAIGLEASDPDAPQIITTGFNYGIPINTYLKLAPQAGIYLGLKVENTPSPELGAPYVASSTPDERDVIDDINNVLDFTNTVIRGIDTGRRLICSLTGC